MDSLRSPEVAGKPLMNLWKIVGIHGEVGRRFYLKVGFGLMLFKYLTEFIVVWMVAKKVFFPITFLIPSYNLRVDLFEAGPPWLPWAMVIWSVPFLWIAVTMTSRRAINAGGSPWVGLWVMVPFINIFVMLGLACTERLTNRNESLVSTLEKPTPEVHLKQSRLAMTKISSATLGIVVGGLFALGLVVISVYTLHSYGSSLFIGMPLVAGTVSGYVYNQPALRSPTSSMFVGMLCVFMGELSLLLFAFEGVICLVMAAPLLLPLGALGGLLGWLFAKTILVQSRMMIGGILVILPFVNLLETHFKDYKELKVESFVVIQAPIDEVWENVISFPEIGTQMPWYFQLGIAAPMKAEIFGQGVGAVRHCEFTTGNFVEPITAWDRPHRLAFNVSDQPEPLIEMTPYRSIHPPHLEHSFLSQRGEFELIELGPNRTKLIGRTWYTVDMGPRIYWRMWTDQIVHRIHLRVLEHIRDSTETLNSTLK